MTWLLAALGTLGVYLVALPQRPRTKRRAASQRIDHTTRTWLTEAGLEGTTAATALAVVGLAGVLGGALGFAMFGGPLPTLATSVTAATIPLASIHGRRTSRRHAAAEHWPALIEEIRVLTSASGRSIPQALIDVGASAPKELKPAFERARREWLLTTDFEQTVSVLKDSLGSASADTTLETLLVAHQVGGADLDRRLAELAQDRRIDLNDRKNAAARQSGVQFSRRFVVLVPFGMALAGMSLGDGRAAYATTTGQLVAAAGIGLVFACWVWSGRLLKLPDERRVFAR